MILIIGGAYQGKLEFAKKKFDIKDEDICDLSKGYIPGERCYYNLEEFMQSGRQLVLKDLEPDAIIIAREVGSGVVPMDKSQRMWRQNHGLLLQELSQKATEVYRVFCGIGVRL